MPEQTHCSTVLSFAVLESTTGAPALTPERLHAHYAPKIRRHISAVLGPDQEREDLVQEVLMTVYRKIGTLRDPACLEGWIAQITANMLKYVMRQRRLRRHASYETLPERHTPLFHADLDGRDLAVRAIRVLERLPANDRELLANYWFTRATAGSIAAENGCSIITVRRRLFRARSRFEKLARRDPELSTCVDERRLSARRDGQSAREEFE